MIQNIKRRINKPVFLMSAVLGGTLWFFCNHLYSVYRLKISGFLMVPALCTLLFAVLFLTVWAGSVLTGSFDRENFYSLLRYKSQFHILFFPDRNIQIRLPPALIFSEDARSYTLPIPHILYNPLCTRFRYSPILTSFLLTTDAHSS